MANPAVVTAPGTEKLHLPVMSGFHQNSISIGDNQQQEHSWLWSGKSKDKKRRNTARLDGVCGPTRPQSKWGKQDYKPDSGSLKTGLPPWAGGVGAPVFRADNGVSGKTGYKQGAQAELIR